MKYPIGLSIILNALAAISILSGCSDYLDREYDSFIDNEMTFTSLNIILILTGGR